MAKKKPAKRRGRRAAPSASTTTTHPHHTPPTTSRSSTPRPSSPRSSTSDESSTFPRLLTVDEVADLLRTTRKAVYGLVYRGALPGVIRLQRRLLIDQATLLQFLRESRGVSLSAKGEQR